MAPDKTAQEFLRVLGTPSPRRLAFLAWSTPPLPCFVVPPSPLLRPHWTPLMIDPTAFIAQGAIVLGDVELGKNASVWFNAVVRGDTARIVIGDSTNIQDLSMVHADPGVPCLVGNRVTVGHRVILHGCMVEDECLIGMGAILLNNVRVGRGSVIGAGALLLEGTEVPPGSLVVGSPGKVVRPVDDNTRLLIEHAWQHYVDHASRHRTGAFPITTVMRVD
jgi:carbonic anhydrase/acetyltransferase-like protein (isoleucine patch superfamily)